MAANWQGQAAQGQYPYQPSTGYQQPPAGYQQPIAGYQQVQTGYPQQQYSGYDAIAYQQYYAQYYAAQQYQQQQAWAQGQHAQQYPQQAWPQNQYPQQYPVQQPSVVANVSVPHPAQQSLQQPPQQGIQPTVQQSSNQPLAVSTAVPNNGKGVSCYNCGAHDHWATACPHALRSSFSAPVATAAVANPGQGKGPVVTKYAVPPHVLAQMKARGVTGTPAVAPSIPYQQPQYPGWQQWQGQAHSQASIPSAYPSQHPQGVMTPNSQQFPIIGTPSMVSQGTPFVSVLQAQTTIATPNTSSSSDVNPSVTTSGVDILLDQETALKGLEDGGQENTEDEDNDTDDVILLDIPDMPASYGTPGYIEPKLVAKPVYSVAPQWTSSGFGEVTLSQDPDGRTHSDYIKPDDIESGISILRTPANEVDPIFATIDLDAPATVKPRSASGDSGRSESEPPQTYESGDTRPTSVDEYEEWPEHMDDSRSRSPQRYERHGQGHKAPRYSAQHNPKRKKRKDRGGRNKDRRGSNGQPGKKRKRDDGDSQDQPQKENSEPQAKKPQSDTPSTTSDQVVAS